MTARPLLLGLLFLAGTGAALAQIPPVPVGTQADQIKSKDPKLAANKKLVFDMYRAIVNGGHAEMAEQFFTPGYIQHNPNVESGRDALVAFIKKTRPARPIAPEIGFPVISIMAEGDMVLVATVTYQDDIENPGKKYANTHFDLYRVENGKVAEHWDHVPKDKERAMHTDPNVTTKKP